MTAYPKLEANFAIEMQIVSSFVSYNGTGNNFSQKKIR